jgi:hypothetical protein
MYMDYLLLLKNPLRDILASHHEVKEVPQEREP